MPRFLLPGLAVLAFCFPCPLWSAPAPARPATSPNLLVILCDGVGFSDPGCFGGEIQTPCLDWLAENGLRFSQAYSAGSPRATGAAFLSGVFGGEVGSAGASRRPAGGQWLPEMLKPAGYVSYHAGQWWLAETPRQAGFDRSFRVDGARHFGPFRQVGDAGESESAEGEYSSIVVADRVIEFLKEHGDLGGKNPFFACVAFPAPGGPLQAPRMDVEAYRGRYQGGTDGMRRERLQRLQEQGVLTVGELPAPALPARRWAELSKSEQEAFETRMEVHAAMVARVDREIGRILDQVKAMKAWENPVMVFLSGSGASAEKELGGAGNGESGVAGSVHSRLGLGPQGASLANTPFRDARGDVHEGGIATPLILHWPAGLRSRGEVREQVVHAVDLAPTLLRLAGVAPGKAGAGSGAVLDGQDLSGLIRENKAQGSRALWWQGAGGRAFRLGDWKWLALKDRPAELYYLRTDRAEMLDVAAVNRERVQEMESQWKRMAQRVAPERVGEVAERRLSALR
ncbi:MAG: Arylsulfatase [Verrucomicrobiota bacterium]